MPTTDIPAEPTPEKPARIPKKPFTEAEIKDLAEAMALPEVNNNVAAAAAKLRDKYPDGSYQRWYKIAKSNEYLRAVHPSSKPEEIVPTTLDTIDRAPLLTEADVREHEALVKQESALKQQDWVALGVNESQANRMLSMEKFARMPIGSMVSTTHGGMMFAFAGLLEVYEKCLKKFVAGDLPAEFDKRGEARDPQEIERDWLYALTACSAEIRSVKKQVDQSNLLMLKAEQLARELRRGAGGGKKQKFGAAPLVAVQAAAGASVTIHEQPQ